MISGSGFRNSTGTLETATVYFISDQRITIGNQNTLAVSARLDIQASASAEL
jgi:hypothetical protein